MSIKQTRYVDIASAVIGASAVPMRKLTARVFQQTLKFLLVKCLNFASGQVDDLLGTDSPRHILRVSISAMSVQHQQVSRKNCKLLLMSLLVERLPCLAKRQAI